jgi:hypothetical protein
MITSNNIIEANPFTGLWLTSVLINKNKAIVTTLPYNGTHALVSPVKRHNILLSDDLLNEIRNAIQRKSLTQTDLLQVIVSAPSPDRPIVIRALFKNVKNPFHIRDVYELAEADPIFGEAFNSIMYQIGAIINAAD